MRQRARVSRLFLAAVGTLGLMAATAWAADLYGKKKSTASKSPTLKPYQIALKLDQLLAEQQQLAQAIEEIKQEVAIVKVRAAAPSIDSCN